MPCRSDFEYDTPKSVSVNYVPLSEHDKITRIACTLSELLNKILEDYVGLDSMNRNEVESELDLYLEPHEIKEILDWIEAHKKADEDRKDRLRESGLSKLNDEEIEALGLVRPYKP